MSLGSLPDYTYLSLLILAVVFLLIAVRQVGGFSFRIWQVMAGGALAVLLTGQISFYDAIQAINFEVLIFLFGMFLLGAALEESGYLFTLGQRLFGKVKTTGQFVLLLIISFGLLSSLLMNDTLAIIGTPLVLFHAQRRHLPSRMLLLALCAAITTGSVMSPIGNPQNLLIASFSGLENPFLSFALYLGAPTLISLCVTFLLFQALYPREMGSSLAPVDTEYAVDPKLSRIARLSLLLLLILIAARTLSPIFPVFAGISLPLIAILSAAPVFLFSPKRLHLVRSVDWNTLVFFVALFVLMGSVWETGVFQSLLSLGAPNSVPGVIALSVIVSQFISNVPFVALFQPLLVYQGIPLSHMFALAAGSTLAGNLTILGAASNVIVIQNAEKHGETLTFLEFLRFGVPLTLIQSGIFTLFLGFL
jgi:Na+/H+ antiporter NhaD/arsenite permease-like protein